MSTALLCSFFAVTAIAKDEDTDPVALEELADDAGAVWQTSAEDFIDANESSGFSWLTEGQHDSARAANRRLNFLGFRVWEAIARFESNRLCELTFSLYNRGDAGKLDDRAWEHLLVSVDEQLTRWANAKGVSFKDEDRTSRATVKRKSWVKEPHRCDLTWSYTIQPGSIEPFRAEYVRVRLTRFDPMQDPRRMMYGPIVNKTKMLTILDLKSHVQRLPNGDVFIRGIPMVDQGKKGYCASAVAERVLRYYGTDIDQHDIAQVADTSAKLGTSPHVLLAALRRIGSEQHLEVSVHYQFSEPDLTSLLDDYNHRARDAGKSEISLASSHYTRLSEVFADMNPKLFREARQKREGTFANLKAAVSKYVNSGAPLAWAVYVGMVDEHPEVHGHGGHLRLIIGLNERTSEILYSDTWGPGHELKRMSLSDAWAITLGLYTLEPRNIRF